VALIEFASRSLPVKVHQKKKNGGRKKTPESIWNKNTKRLTARFFCLRFFLGVQFNAQTPGTCLHHTGLLVGVTDPCNSGVFIFES
jgi:hypothetical protein